MNYNLPDHNLLKSEQNSGFKIFTPDKNYLVLGRSNQAESSINMKLALADQLTVLQRASGGEAVLLTPNMLVIAIKMPIIKDWKPKQYFEKANGAITTCLVQMGVQNLHSKGISDLSIGDKKILGSAIFRSKESMFYHAVLNISEDIELIAKYLKHPKKEPDYRKGRNHSEFITSLLAENYSIKFEGLKHCLKNVLTNSFFITLAR